MLSYPHAHTGTQSEHSRVRNINSTNTLKVEYWTLRRTSSISRKSGSTHRHTHVACMLIQPLSPSFPSFHPVSPPSLPLSSFIPPSLADLHYAALINTPLFLASRLLNVKTGNQRVPFHLEWKSKVPGCFSAPCRRAGHCLAHESSGKSSMAWKDTGKHKRQAHTCRTQSDFNERDKSGHGF